jgi:hypothetical protein
MRTSGEIEYITPLQIATESSTVPKSVMKTMVGIDLPDVLSEALAGRLPGHRISNIKTTKQRDGLLPRKLSLSIVRSR